MAIAKAEKASTDAVGSGDVFVIETPGGGGYGKAGEAREAAQ